MGILNSNKIVNVSDIDCSGTFKVTISLTAAPDITSNPTDIALVLDRSGSMAGSPLANMKLGAKKFIDIIDESTDGSQDGNIGSGSHIGIVSFAGSAVQDTQLITSVADLKSAVDALSSGGPTNHADAFTKAIELFDPMSANAKVIVIFTDGETTIGPPPSTVAAEARAMGITIYCIGLTGSDGIDINTLNDWATDPDSAHVVVTPDDAELEDIFADLAANISKPGATDIQIDEVLNPDFEIVGLPTATKGSVIVVNSTTLKWQIAELGVKGNESAALEFMAKHISHSSGTKYVNKSITYSDKENNTVTFPNPTVTVDCGTVVIPERCPIPVDIQIPGCKDSIVYDIGDINMESLGRILQITVTIKNVCPERRVALGIILTEADNYGVEYKRGLKTVTIPAHHSQYCRDVHVKCIRFVLPEDLNVSGPSNGICSKRNFKVRVIANYIDNDFDCCKD